jgi:hypothetical protein
VLGNGHNGRKGHQLGGRAAVRFAPDGHGGKLMEAGRAYSTLAVKSFTEDARGYSFAGLATSPVADRVNDRIDPLGARYKNPTVMLRAHDHTMPIGECVFGRPTKAGIAFDAMIPKISEPGLLKDRLDMAAQEVATGLMRGVSIGFLPTKPPQANELGGFDYPATEIFELSTCAVPMHQLATIDHIKAIDAGILRGEAPAVPVPQSKSALEALVDAAHDAPDAKALREMMWAEADDMIKEAVAEHGKDWSVHAGMGVTARFANILTSYMVAKFGQLEQRLDEPALAYAGVHQRALGYRRGQAVTHKGNIYIALDATEPGDIPGESVSWQLAVRAGRDGKDAK